jgi:imidazolonepropionase-like amidohydrolase
MTSEYNATSRQILLWSLVALALISISIGLAAQARPGLSDVTRQFITVDAPVVVLQHARVIDGTGGPVTENQTIVIGDGLVRSVGPDASASVPTGARTMDLSGRTVFPGLVGMHDHLHYATIGPLILKPGAPVIWMLAAFTAPRLYLANGVTTVRPTGTWEPDTEINLKRQIDAGEMPGPDIYVTGPFLDGDDKGMFQNHVLSGPEDAARVVNFWIDEGVTNFKAYQHVTRAELAAMIKAAHARGAKVTGHLCAVSFPEAIDLEIDGLEHGIRTDTEFTARKQPDVCPPAGETASAIAGLDIKGKPVQDLIHKMVQHHVSVTSTLAVFEPAPGRPIQAGVLQALAPPALENYLASVARRDARSDANQMSTAVYQKEAEFERDFVKAGGLLMAGPDTGQAGLIGGFGDLRDVELLVDEGFTVSQAIQIASYNGAQWLGIGDKLGTIKPGKQADLVVARGDPTHKIEEIENVEIVFKKGRGFDAQKLLQSVQGQVGIR